MKKNLATIGLMGISTIASSHEYLNFEEMTAAFGMDFEKTEIRVQAVAPGLHVLFGVGGNVIASIGDQGVLLVDSQFPQMIPRIRDAIGRLGGEDVDFAINTHWHFDHVDGNALLGRDGTWFVAHRNSRRMMTGERGVNLVSIAYLQPASPPEAMPVITYDDRMYMHFNGEAIDMMHFGPAHTTGDTAVYFRSANVIHMGDVFNATFPFIDAGNGGDIDGMILFCEQVLGEINKDTVVVPGHGPIMGYDDLSAFVIMLETVRNRIATLIDAGRSLDEIVAANTTAEFEERYGNPSRFIDRVFTSLSR